MATLLPYLILLMAIAMHLIFFGVAVRVIWGSRRERTTMSDAGARAWEALAEDVGFEPAARRMEGALRGVPARLHVAPSQFGGFGFKTHCELSTGALFQGALYTEGAVVADSPAWRSVHTGDAEFDRRFVLRCAAEDEALALLSFEVRRALLELRPQVEVIRIDREGVRVEAHGILEDALTLRVLVDAVEALLVALINARAAALAEAPPWAG